MILNETYRLSNGTLIPKIGLGTWMIDDDQVAQAVVEAITLGYRHIDTAQAYQNERGVGEGIRRSGVSRDELFITTKVAAEAKTYEEAAASIDDSLEKLGLDIIDLMIIHSPWPWESFNSEDRFFEGNLEAWRALEDAYEAGKLRAIGVSNFEVPDLQNILDNGRVKPMVDQVLAHITHTPHETIEFCQKNGIQVEGYSPMGHGELMKNQEVAAMAEKYGVSIPQLGIRYDLQLGLVALPKSTKVQHMKNNADVDFDISDADMNTLRNMKRIQDYGDASVFPVYQKDWQ